MKKYRFAVTLVLPDDHGHSDVRWEVEHVLADSETISAVECQLDVELVDTSEHLFPDVLPLSGTIDEDISVWYEEAQRFLERRKS